MKQGLIVLRFSAMGDVAMCAAVVRDFAVQHPDTPVVMVSRGAFAPFFADIPNVRFHPIDSTKRHKGLPGLLRLFLELRRYKPAAVADLHYNLRSRILAAFFRSIQTPVAQLNKHREEKKRLTRRERKVLTPLRPMVECYADVFRQLGFGLQLSKVLRRVSRPIPVIYAKYFQSSTQPKIGFSPFAQHTQKVYPFEKSAQLLSALSKLGYQVFIFGGGEAERKQAALWAKTYSNVINTIGTLSLSQELDLTSRMDLAVSMDSSGMHMASLMGVRTLSIWGATHPNAGFLGYAQSRQDCILHEISCRPCSVYGNKPCFRGDLACLNLLNPGTIIARIKESLGS